MGISHDRAKDREDHDPQPIGGSIGEWDSFSLKEEKGGGEEAGPGHFVECDDEVVGFLDMEAVDDRENGGEKG